MIAPSIYAALGGESGVQKLVDDFYDEMESNAAAKVVRAMHATSLKSSREKLFMFLSGWFGGPSLYIKQYGHPRLRRRHFPFAIDSAAAAEWMVCMRVALDQSVLEGELRMQVENAFLGMANHMRNVEDAGE